MTEWLRGFALLVTLIVVPFLVDALFGSHRRIYGSYFELAWNGLLAYLPIIAGAILIGIVGIIWFNHERQTGKISEFLTLAENELNSLLRTWGRGLSASARKDIAKERADWLSMIDPASEKRDMFFDLNQRDLEGKGQAAAGAKACMTAFLLREVYQGRIEAARSKIITETKHDKDRNPPYVAPGLRELLGMDQFEKDGIFSSAPYSPRRIRRTVRRHGYPRDLKMVKTDADGRRYEILNRDVIEELTRQEV